MKFFLVTIITILIIIAILIIISITITSMITINGIIIIAINIFLGNIILNTTNIIPKRTLLLLLLTIGNCCYY